MFNNKTGVDKIEGEWATWGDKFGVEKNRGGNNLEGRGPGLKRLAWKIPSRKKT